MDIVAFTDAMFDIERRLDLFGDRMGDIAWWDTIRYESFHRIYYRVAGLREPTAPARPARKRLAGYLARNALNVSLLAKSHARDYDVVAFPCPRNRAGRGRIDIATEQILELVPGRMLRIDTHPHYFHRHLDRRSPVKRPALLQAAIEQIERLFGVQPGLESFMLERLARFHAALDDYTRLFEAIAPRAIFMVQNGVEKSMFCAARRHRIPVAEIQHGLIQYVHPSYSYPRGLGLEDLSTFPTHFLAFSQYWIDTCHYPVRACSVTGNDHYFIERQAGCGDVLFVSGFLYDAVLRDWVKAAAAACPDRKFVYKMHPNQWQHEGDARMDLSKLPNIEVIGPQKSIRTLLASVSTVVVIQSTVAHEALQAGKTLCVLPLFDYQTHQDLFKLPEVFLTDTHEALIDAISAPPPERRPPLYFERFDAARTRQIVRAIVEGQA